MVCFTHISSKASAVPSLHPSQFPFFVDVEAVFELCEKYDSYGKSNIYDFEDDINEILKFVKPLGENYKALLEEMRKQLETPLCYYPWVLITTGFYALNFPK